MPGRWHPSILRDPRPITTAAAAPLPELPGKPADLLKYASWQEEAWQYWRSLGELNQGVSWLSNSLSRVGLVAAEKEPGGDEPVPLEGGVAADLMAAFGGVGGQSGIMATFGVQLAVPGEAWLVVERDSTSIPLAAARWRVVPTSALRPGGRGPTRIQVGDNVWRPLADEGLTTKIWKEDPQFPWRPFSAVQAALSILQRIDLVDRRIVAYMVSRLAVNGLLIIPQEGTFTVPKQYKDAADPFVAQLIDAGQNGISRPGTASAALPLIVRFAAEYIDKWRLLRWDDVLSAELLDEREKEIRRLAVTLSMPIEWITGMGDVKFWNAFHLTEEAIKLYVAPYAQIIAEGVTVGYLHPLLKQMDEPLTGPSGHPIVVWYDTSELTAPADKSTQVTTAYDRLEVSGAALRRELGLDEADAPTGDDLRTIALKRLIGQPASALTALAELTGTAPKTSDARVNGSDSSIGSPTDSPPRQLPPRPADAAARLSRPSPRPRHTPLYR